MKKQKLITLLGSTGSIGTQALDVVRQHPDRFGSTRWWPITAWNAWPNK